MNSTQKKQWQDKVDEYNNLADKYNKEKKWNDETCATYPSITSQEELKKVGDALNLSHDKMWEMEQLLKDISGEIHSMEFQFNGWTAYNMN